MAFPTKRELPIIDIAPFLNSDTGDADKRHAAAYLHRACLNYGFFYLNIDAYVDRSEAEELARLARAFFTLPQEEKDKLSLANQDFARGMCGLMPNIENLTTLGRICQVERKHNKWQSRCPRRSGFLQTCTKSR